jgi:hypothetical protein
MKTGAENRRLWLARLLVGTVLLVNVQCALVFIWRPEAYSPGFELPGAAGAAAVRGLGVLFLMWNVPYTVAVVHPGRHRISLYEAIAMQAIGLSGETLILLSLPALHAVARTTTTRFILFDAAGLAALCLAAWITRRHHSTSQGARDEKKI